MADEDLAGSSEEEDHYDDGEDDDDVAGSSEEEDHHDDDEDDDDVAGSSEEEGDVDLATISEEEARHLSGQSHLSDTRLARLMRHLQVASCRRGAGSVSASVREVLTRDDTQNQYKIIEGHEGIMKEGG